MPRRIGWALLLAILTVGCGLIPQSMRADDPRLEPFRVAMSRVDRESLGFTPIARDAEILLEGKQMWGDDYDAMLHIHAETSRTIAFRKTETGYEWIGEQEHHTGPGTRTTVDGTFKESIVITYETEELSGAPLNSIFVTYFGNDPRLAHRSGLTLTDVAPILQEWRQKP